MHYYLNESILCVIHADIVSAKTDTHECSDQTQTIGLILLSRAAFLCLVTACHKQLTINEFLLFTIKTSNCSLKYTDH